MAQWEGCLLLLERTQVWFLAPTSDDSQPSATPSPVVLSPLLAFVDYALVNIHTQTQIIKSKNVLGNSKDIKNNKKIEEKRKLEPLICVVTTQ